jgi:hypothetical protein
MAANTQEFLDPFTAVKKGRDHNATSLGIVLSDTGATGVVQFANAMLAAPTDYFSGTKIILVERNPFFNAVTSVVEPLPSLNETEVLGTLLTNKVAKAELMAQRIRRTFLGKDGYSLNSGSLLAKLHPSTASIQYCHLFCSLGGHNRHYRHADPADIGELNERRFRPDDLFKKTSHLGTWNGLYHFLGVNTEETVTSHDPKSCSAKTPFEVISGSFGANATRLRDWAASHSSLWAPMIQSPSPECSKSHFSRMYSRMKLLSSESLQMSAHSERNANSSLRAFKLVAAVYAPLLSNSLRKAVSELGSETTSTSNDASHNVLGALRESMRIRNSGDGMDNTGVQRDFFARHTKMKSSSFIDFPGATDKFCHDNNDPSHVGPPMKTAVCFVGVTRTMNRPDVSESFLYRFLAGWGLRSLSIFAVLVKNDSTSLHTDVYTQLSRFNTVATEWYRDTLTEDAKGHMCPDNNEVKQLKQWSRCMTMVEAYEQKTSTLFDAVVKIRPDDLWYGAMPPYCALNLKTNAYISRQQKRWSDQWFALPRNLAQDFFHAVRTGLRPYCHYQRKPLVNCSKVRKSGSPPFEEMIFDFLKSQALKKDIHVTSLILPRILTRQKEEEAAKTSKHAASQKNVRDMCQRFKWYLGSEDCQRMVTGTKKYMSALSAE